MCSMDRHILLVLCNELSKKKKFAAAIKNHFLDLLKPLASDCIDARSKKNSPRNQIQETKEMVL